MALKTVPFRIYVQILIFSALVLLGALILIPLQRTVQTVIIGIRDELITSLEQRIDRKIRYSSISPSVFGSFDIRNVRIIGSDEKPVLSMSRFRIVYSLPDLLRGKTQAIHSVRIDSPFIDFDTGRDHDLINLFNNLSSSPDDAPVKFQDLFPEKLMVRIRNGKCLVYNRGDQYELDAFNFNIEIAANRLILDGGWNISAVIDTLIGEPVQLQVAMKTSGSFQTDFEDGEAVFSIPSVIGDAVSSGPIAFGFVLEDRHIRMGKMPDQLPFDLSLEYGLHDGTIDALFECNDFSLRDFVSFSGRLKGVSQFLDIAGTGAASLERLIDGSISYSVDISGTAPAGNTVFLQSGKSSFRIISSGNEERVFIDTFRLSMPVETDFQEMQRENISFFGDIGFSGSVGLLPFAPDGVLSLTHFSLSGSDDLNTDITVTSHNDGARITFNCPDLNIGKIDLSDFIAVLNHSEDTFDFTVSVLRPGSGPDGPQGSLSLDGVFKSESRRLDAELKLASFTIGDLSGMALPFVKNASMLKSLNSFLGVASVNTELDFSVSGRERRFELNNGLFTNGNDTLSLSGLTEFANRRDINFALNAAYRDIEYRIEGELLDGKSVIVHGSYGLELDLISSGARGYTGSVNAGNFPLPFAGSPAYLSFAAQIRYTSAASWFVNVDSFDLSNISGPVKSNTSGSGSIWPAQIKITGGADQNGVNLSQLSYRDAIGVLSGTADIFWPPDYSGFTGTIDMSDGREHCHVQGDFSNGHLDLALSGAYVRLERIFGKNVNALANGDINVSWDSFDSFRAELNLASVHGKIRDFEIGANARVILDNNELTVNSLDFKFAELEGSVSRLVMSGTQGFAESRAVIKGHVGRRPVKGGLTLSAGFRPVQSWFEIDKLLNSVTGTARIEDFSYGSDGETQNFNIAFSRVDSALSVSGGPRDMIRIRMDPDGNFFAGLSSPFPVRGTVIGSVKNKIIDARCGDLYVDMGELFKLMPESTGFYMTGGYVNASVDIKGSITDPEFFGSARGTSLRIMIPRFISHELRPIPFNVAIEGNEAHFGPVPVAVGSGAGTATAEFIIDRWIPNIFSIDIAIPRETAIPYNFDINGFTSRGDAFGSLNVSMENLAFDVTGALSANNTELGFNYDDINRSQSGYKVRFPYVVDITVSTGPIVEFFYPRSRFPILRATPEMGSKIHITADSLAQQYTLTGDVKIRSGEMYYFERSFFIRSGTLTLRENELRFDPRIAVRAEVRDRSEDGPVTISMIVDNAPLRSFTARFESTPPLSQMDIFALLGQNITGSQPDENANSILRTSLSSGSELLAQFVLGRQIEQQIRNFTGLDMFSVRTQVIQNALFMATGLMQPPVDSIGGIGNYFDNTTVFGGKYIGQDMFVQGMLSMRYDANNTSLGGLTFAPDIGIELQNPLFSIRWDFVPTHPENWYVNDNSITLTWSKTF